MSIAAINVIIPSVFFWPFIAMKYQMNWFLSPYESTFNVVDLLFSSVQSGHVESYFTTVVNMIK